VTGSGPAGRFHVVLVGLPGSGKTTAGPLLANLLGADFMDLDREIEKRQRASISEIFAAHGEPAFREMERALTRELAGRPAMVLSPGGGWMADPENVGLLRPPARIIHLQVTVQTALRRLGPDVALRPLLAGAAVDRQLESLSAVRMPLYSRADGAINTETLTPQQVAEVGLRLASAWGWPIG
jgi:shikimate kinase